MDEPPCIYCGGYDLDLQETNSDGPGVVEGWTCNDCGQRFSTLNGEDPSAYRGPDEQAVSELLHSLRKEIDDCKRGRA